MAGLPSELKQIITIMTLKELKQGKSLSNISVNAGSTEIAYHYVYYQGEGIGIGAFQTSSNRILAALVKLHGSPTMIGSENLKDSDYETRKSLEHLFLTYFG